MSDDKYFLKSVSYSSYTRLWASLNSLCWAENSQTAACVATSVSANRPKPPQQIGQSRLHSSFSVFKGPNLSDMVFVLVIKDVCIELMLEHPSKLSTCNLGQNPTDTIQPKKQLHIFLARFFFFVLQWKVVHG